MQKDIEKTEGEILNIWTETSLFDWILCRKKINNVL